MREARSNPLPYRDRRAPYLSNSSPRIEPGLVSAHWDRMRGSRPVAMMRLKITDPSCLALEGWWRAGGGLLNSVQQGIRRKWFGEIGCTAGVHRRLTSIIAGVSDESLHTALRCSRDVRGGGFEYGAIPRNQGDAGGNIARSSMYRWVVWIDR